MKILPVHLTQKNIEEIGKSKDGCTLRVQLCDIRGTRVISICRLGEIAVQLNDVWKDI